MKIVHYFLLIFFISFFPLNYAYCDSCDSGTIRSITSDGNVITLTNDTIWKVDSVDTNTVIGWISGDNVLMCGDGYMINSDKNERVLITQLQETD